MFSKALGTLKLTIRLEHKFLRSISLLEITRYILGARGYMILLEAAAAIELGVLLALCIYRRGMYHEDLELLFQNRVFLDTIEKKVPHVLQWYRTINGCHFPRFSEWMKVYRDSPSIFGRTPAIASRKHKAEMTQGLWEHSPLPGKVRLHFFTKYQHGGCHITAKGSCIHGPEAQVDVDFDPVYGVDLRKTRQLLGVEKLSVMTDISPSRPIFHPVDENRLSPIAAYDLSKQFKKPIHIFEPGCSRLTKLKRKIHEPIYVSVYFISTLLRSVLGFSYKDSTYGTVVFGETFTTTCTTVSRLMEPLNSWACEGAWLLTQLAGFLLLLPFVIVYQTGKGMKFISILMLSSALVWIRCLSAAAGNSFSVVSHLSVKGWVVAITLAWFMIVE